MRYQLVAVIMTCLILLSCSRSIGSDEKAYLVNMYGILCELRAQFACDHNVKLGGKPIPSANRVDVEAGIGHYQWSYSAKFYFSDHKKLLNRLKELRGTKGSDGYELAHDNLVDSISRWIGLAEFVQEYPEGYPTKFRADSTGYKLPFNKYLDMSFERIYMEEVGFAVNMATENFIITECYRRTGKYEYPCWRYGSFK